MREKLTMKDAKERFGNAGFFLLESEYKSAITKMRCKCSNGHIIFKKMNDFPRKGGCPICSGNYKKTIQEVASFLNEDGYILISKEYKGTKEKLDVICPNGHTTTTSANTFLRGQRCQKCLGNYKKTLKEIKIIFGNEGYIVNSKKYSTASEKLDVICSNGHEIKTSANNFFEGARCAICYHEYTRKENHWNWNPNLTDEDRLERRSHEIKVWRKKVYQRDNYTCKKCNKRAGVLNAHHICNFADYKDLRIDVSNGITFCKDCHKNFHKKYGLRNTSKSQMKEFIGGK